MCQAFSALITKEKKVYWEAGLDSHSDIQSKFVKDDDNLKDDKMPPDNTFARIEITPKNGDHLNPDEWVFKLDENIKPKWWRKACEKPCFNSLEDWKKKVYTFNIEEAKNPINPFKIKAPKITKKHLTIVRKWASVRDSVGDSVGVSVWASVGVSVGDSVWASVGASVGASVRDSVGDSVGVSVGDSVGDSVGVSVGDSVGDSVGAYNGSLFTGIKKWKYCENIKEKGYPFQSCVDLWKKGLIAVKKEDEWILLGSPKGDGKCEILWKGKI